MNRAEIMAFYAGLAGVPLNADELNREALAIAERLGARAKRIRKPRRKPRTQEPGRDQ